jgi:hypothetical protein
MGRGEQSAIQAALDSGLAPDGLFPESVGRAACLIRGHGIHFMGVCTTWVGTKTDSTWEVTFTEYWSASQFYGGNDPSSGELLHYWTIGVLQDGQTMLLAQGGNGIPQAVK